VFLQARIDIGLLLTGQGVQCSVLCAETSLHDAARVATAHMACDIRCTVLAALQHNH
jgi:hypothetical protein